MKCIECNDAKFPDPTEQCCKFGGLICGRAKDENERNVGKYDECQFTKKQKA